MSDSETTRPRGRPRKYLTEEERINAKIENNRRNKEYAKELRKRAKEGLPLLPLSPPLKPKTDKLSQLKDVIGILIVLLPEGEGKTKIIKEIMESV